jgi:hypothetical protein
MILRSCEVEKLILVRPKTRISNKPSVLRGCGEGGGSANRSLITEANSYYLFNDVETAGFYS